MPISRTWYVSCSPRSPEKIAPELAELAKLDGVRWWEKDSSGALIHQIAFADALKQLESFEGRISANNPALSARDRLAPIQTFGFASIDSTGRLHITPAGWRLIQGKGVHELFLKQMLKWQYPSWQHGGNPRSRHRYPLAAQIDTFPFVETLRVCRALEGLSKEEIAIFLLPVLNRKDIPSAIQSIADFRVELRKHRGLSRTLYVRQVHRQRFHLLYAPEIEQGEIATRESQTVTVDDFLDKKMRNSTDVADAAIRYFRYTGLFTVSADFHRLIISSQHAKEVDRILDEMEFPLVTFYDDVDQFYAYLGNPDQPKLPWERRSELAARASKLGVERSEINRLTLAGLKDTIERAQDKEKDERLREFTKRAQSPESVQDIIATFDRIRGRDVIDPPLFLEWNTWRAMLSMDDCTEARPNFTLDDDLQPLSVAPGNRPDMEIEYNGEFAALVEVTMSQGARQYDSEGEPVTRHIGRFQVRERRGPSPRPVYGLFIAPSIDRATRDYFYVHLKHMANPDFGGYLNIIPLSINQFVDVFRSCKSLPDFKRSVLQDLFERVVVLKNSTESGADWEKQLPSAIEGWKRHWQVPVEVGDK